MQATPTQDGFRHELKFVVPERVRLALAILLGDLCERDRNGRGDEGEYEVRSVYFDSRDLASFHDKVGGVQDRQRFRLRTYATPGSPAFLEQKQRHGALIRKRRLSLGPLECEQLLAGRSPSLPASDLLQAFEHARHLRALQPLLRVEYMRTAFAVRGPERVRLTLDRDPVVRRARTLGLSSAPARRILPRGQAIVELKFAHHMPAWFPTLAARFQLRATPCSKYCMALEELDRRNVLAFA
jgi:hypothetical protein